MSALRFLTGMLLMAAVAALMVLGTVFCLFAGYAWSLAIGVAPFAGVLVLSALLGALGAISGALGYSLLLEGGKVGRIALSSAPGGAIALTGLVATFWLSENQGDVARTLIAAAGALPGSALIARAQLRHLSRPRQRAAAMAIRTLACPVAVLGLMAQETALSSYVPVALIFSVIAALSAVVAKSPARITPELSASSR